MKPETKALRGVLAGIGVKAAQVRTDRPLHGTTATIFEPDDIETVSERAGDLVSAGYGVVVRRYEDGCPLLALVTTDSRRAGVTETTVPGSHRCTKPVPAGGVS